MMQPAVPDSLFPQTAWHKSKYCTVTVPNLTANTLPIIFSFKLVYGVRAWCIQCKISECRFSHSCQLLSHFLCLQSKTKHPVTIKHHTYFRRQYTVLILNLSCNNSTLTFDSPFWRMVSMSSSVMAESLEANTWFAPYRIMFSISSLFSWFCLLSTRRPVQTDSFEFVCCLLH